MTNQAQFRNNSAAATSTSTTTVVTDPGVFRQIREAYVDNIGPLTGAIAHYLEDLMDEGMAPVVILDAITQTGWAPRPSPQYLRAILRRYSLENIYTEQDLQYSKLRRQRERDEANAARWKRWYAPDQDQELPF